MIGGALGNTWLAGNATVAATVEMWRAWLFGPLPTPEPSPVLSGGYVRRMVQRPAAPYTDPDDEEAVVVSVLAILSRRLA